MTRQQIEALVNKGRITQVGAEVQEDLENLSDEEICEQYVTCAEVAAEILEGSTTEPDTDSNETTEPDTDSNETTEPDTDSNETTEPDTDSNETTEPDTDAPVVDPLDGDDLLDENETELDLA
jgi:hypothetical protein